MEKTTKLLPDMIPMRDFSKISDGDRLFYEIGYIKNRDIEEMKAEEEVYQNWVRTGDFKEVENVKEFLDGYDHLDGKILLENQKFLEHHNFMVIKNFKHGMVN